MIGIAQSSLHAFYEQPFGSFLYFIALHQIYLTFTLLCVLILQPWLDQMTFLVVRCVVFPINFRGHWGALIVQLENGTAHAPLLLYAALIGIKLNTA